jgi:hypothetical protein
MVLTLIARSPRGPGFVVPVAARLLTARLSLSVGRPEPRAFAVRLGIARLARPTRPPHPRSTFRDDRDTPLVPERDARTILLIYRICKAEYFCPVGWTEFCKAAPTGKSANCPTPTCRIKVVAPEPAGAARSEPANRGRVRERPRRIDHSRPAFAQNCSRAADTPQACPCLRWTRSE